MSHYGSFALKGVGMIIIETISVEPRGRGTPDDPGLWSDQHIPGLKCIVVLIKSQGTVAAIQLHHVSRKGGLYLFFSMHSSSYLHSFLSGNTNKRTDQYDGSFENRLRYPLELVQAIRDVWPKHKPLWLRLSGTDYRNPETLGSDPEGWDLFQSTEYAKRLKMIGVDVIDVSSGDNLSGIKYPFAPLYQVPLAKYIKENANISAGIVGRITEPQQAEDILQNNEADYVLLAREFLRNAAWANRAAKEFDITTKWANQYTRAQRERP